MGLPFSDSFKQYTVYMVPFYKAQQANEHVKTETDRETQPIVHEQKASLCACTYRDSALKHMHIAHT